MKKRKRNGNERGKGRKEMSRRVNLKQGDVY